MVELRQRYGFILSGATPCKLSQRGFLALLVLCASVLLPTTTQAARKTPNILFVIMDDVGVDQMEVFGYGGETPPRTPTISTIAEAGISFRNAWSMPACSTSRAVFFNGRFPLRTQVFGALGPNDLANAQVSPFETTLPTLLKQRGYQSALFGKFHLGLQGHNPFGEGMPRALGWDYFFGWLDETGDPSSIDTTAGTGDTAEKGPYSCGFIPAADQGGADFGACYTAQGDCRNLAAQNGIPPGRACRDGGGILDPGKSCRSTVPSNILAGFNNLSAHYVSPLVINHENGLVVKVPPTDIRARTYRGSSQVDAAISWIKHQSKNQPWMASVSFASAHTPVMQPPQALLQSNPAATSRLSCATGGDEPLKLALQQRELTNLMIEAIDTELARLLVSTGLARQDKKGRLEYNPRNTNTVIVILGDNGALGTSVKLPFDPTRAKGTAYQTGVWVPLIVSGPIVNKPDRVVSHMVNIADLYQLFGEIADIDVPASVPHTLDSVPMLPYLTNPKQASIRSWNFTQVGPNAQANGAINGPCTIGTSCTHIPVTKKVCEDNSGTWWGEGADAPVTNGIPAPDGLQHCCQVNQFLYSQGQDLFDLQPLSAVAIRNENYKVVRNLFQGDRQPVLESPDPPGCEIELTDEFYAIDEAVPLPRIDREGMDLNELPVLTREQQANYQALSEQLLSILSSEPPCPGDGNLDGVVDQLDKEFWSRFADLSAGKSSWYDMDQDGLTNAQDLVVIEANLGKHCWQAF